MILTLLGAAKSKAEEVVKGQIPRMHGWLDMNCAIQKEQ